MTYTPMFNQIAARSLQFRCADGSEAAVLVRIGAPHPDSSGPRENWACPYEISAFDRTETRAMFGIDSVQALILTLHILPTELRGFARENREHFLDEEDMGLEGTCRSNLEFAR